MKKMFAAFTVLSLCLLGNAFAGSSADAEFVKESLQEVQDFVGTWKGICTNEKDRSDFWTEKSVWSWSFKGKTLSFAANMTESKLYKSATLNFLPRPEKYELTFVDKKDNKLVYTGKLKGKRLVVEHVDPKSKDVYRYDINSASQGDRLILALSVKPANRTLFFKVHQIAYTRDGVTFASAGNKKNECVVTGGLGTSTVSYQGVTYWVCCSGCRDAFNADPDKIIKEYRARKKRGN